MTDGQPPPAKVFLCSVCKFSAPYTVHGRSLSTAPPPGSDVGRHLAANDEDSKIVFLDDCYLLPDPNASRVRPLCLGGNCSLCGAIVCTGAGCSLFYARRFCASCARAHADKFPAECRKLAPRVFESATHV